MAAVFASLSEVGAAVAPLADSLAVAAVNGAGHVVVSGSIDAVGVVVDGFIGRGVRVQPLVVSHAFHSPLMEPMLEEFRRVASSVTFHAPTATIVSNLTGGVIGAEIADAGVLGASCS